MIDVESVITLFLIFLNILIVSYSLKNNINNSDDKLKTSNSIFKKSTDLPIFIVKTVFFLSVILSFIIFFRPLVGSSRIGFLNDILEFILEFTFIHLVIYSICSLFYKKYNFVKISVAYCIWHVIKIIIILSLQLLA